MARRRFRHLPLETDDSHEVTHSQAEQTHVDTLLQTLAEMAGKKSVMYKHLQTS